MFFGKKLKKVRSLVAGFAVAAATLASTANAQVVRPTLHDFVGDNKTDWVTIGFAASSPIRWKLTGNPASAVPNAAFKKEFDFGVNGATTAASDAIVPANYSGDSKSEVSVYRRSTQTFYTGAFPSGAGNIVINNAFQFGIANDNTGGQGDYDGDGREDYTLVRVTAANGALTYYILLSSTNTLRTVPFGNLTGQVGTAIFPGADFNNDGRDEFVLLNRTVSGALVTYYAGDSVTGAGVLQYTFGDYDTDYSVAPDDYTGDGRADFVAVRQSQGANGIWYIVNPVNNAVTATPFGIADPDFVGEGDVPVRGDFDGDGRHDICVWRSTNQTFYYISTLVNSIQAQQSGNETDTPLGSFALY